MQPVQRAQPAIVDMLGEVPDQLDPKPADRSRFQIFRLRRQFLRQRIERPAIVADRGMQRRIVSPHGDMDLMRGIGLKGVRQDIGDRLLEAELHRVVGVRRQSKAVGQLIDPGGQSRDLRTLVADSQ